MLNFLKALTSSQEGMTLLRKVVKAQARDNAA